MCRSFEEVSGCRNWDSEIGHVLRNPRVRNVYRTPIFTRARPVVKLSNITLPWHSIHSRGIATHRTPLLWQNNLHRKPGSHIVIGTILILDCHEGGFGQYKFCVDLQKSNTYFAFMRQVTVTVLYALTITLATCCEEFKQTLTPDSMRSHIQSV